ncbi:MXAN_6640 family putative metalloprotease [Nocardioides sp.]|uniref:MXAN_6640 family putative metalloprotease n=1 Tax=Nocardioides sp. TaxID=35761 RepID=UPI0035149ACC
MSRPARTARPRPAAPGRHLGVALLALVLAVLAAPLPSLTGAAQAEPVDRAGAAPLTSAAGHGRDGLDTSLLMRNLFRQLPRLDGPAEALVRAQLARPTDGARDPYGDGYSVGSQEVCNRRLCVHYVTSTADAPPSLDWVRATLQVMDKVWTHHVKRLGYRPPASDRGRGGNAKFDVYLKELGSQGLYGYCAPERRVPGARKRASGFCVLDNDFARAQFGRAPLETLKVTAAHEFFHAIQFNYDFTEDGWLLETTATWMEERYADDVNDNRNYLPYGQVARPGSSLDVFDPRGFNQYGNWTWWQFLQQRYGQKIVRQVIERTGTGRGLPDDYSVQGLAGVLRTRGGLAANFAGYAAANLDPARTYPEGKAWPTAKPRSTTTLSTGRRSTSGAVRIDHLSSAAARLVPADSLRGAWKVQIGVDGPEAQSSPAAVVVTKKRGGGLRVVRVKLNSRGVGAVTVPFSSKDVAWVTVVLANASTRYRCGVKTDLACQGRPLDNGKRFAVAARVVR